MPLHPESGPLLGWLGYDYWFFSLYYYDESLVLCIVIFLQEDERRYFLVFGCTLFILYKPIDIILNSNLLYHIKFIPHIFGIS